ncbi:multisubunit Na+/H+ antiporter, MnhF subunit [Sphaerochaeta pleomorpha str. Grapes]|uniref:Multisubunit Na+/H+ antiporter, MnhF subunit n=1 Tax=Sphaerochaeta pleomorpha (strain ATCC BAA-1885 / DSM 22778 / Grapes) TaxID=158190 RepID=G8QTU6_SPHPG|nr:monovalent cation/H+ antiporter complex subunit F [Sphaerochaeta pleomorpha]AEV29122.1 multisubunit Na+/H+ antiporter, MnhF subunit [Sphaerochaeta pleomorpha str. Grapes]
MKYLMLEIMQYLLVVCAALCILKLLLGPTTAHRLVALNILSAVALAFLVIRAVEKGRVLYLDVALVYDIFGFLGFLAITRFLKNKEREEEPKGGPQ